MNIPRWMIPEHSALRQPALPRRPAVARPAAAVSLYGVWRGGQVQVQLELTEYRNTGPGIAYCTVGREGAEITRHPQLPGTPQT